jgi:hypothetical protein
MKKILFFIFLLLSFLIVGCSSLFEDYHDNSETGHARMNRSMNYKNRSGQTGSKAGIQTNSHFGI